MRWWLPLWELIWGDLALTWLVLEPRFTVCSRDVSSLWFMHPALGRRNSLATVAAVPFVYSYRSLKHTTVVKPTIN